MKSYSGYQCRWGQTAWDGDCCKECGGCHQECGCVTQPEMTEGLENKKSTLFLGGYACLAVGGLAVAAFALNAATGGKFCGQCAARVNPGGDGAGRPEPHPCQKCCLVSVPVFFFAAAAGLLAAASGVDVVNDYWEGCP